MFEQELNCVALGNDFMVIKHLQFGTSDFYTLMSSGEFQIKIHCSPLLEFKLDFVSIAWKLDQNLQID
jgi:hypothetical protein